MTIVLKTRLYKNRGYILTHEAWNMPFCPEVRLRCAYSWPGLFYIGDSKMAFNLNRKFRINEFYPREEIDAPTLSDSEKALNVLLKGHEFDFKKKTCTIGFSSINQMWYGFGRAIAGFTIGSKVEKGDLAFQASNKEDFIEDFLHFWGFDKDGKEIHTEYSSENVNKILHTIDTDVKDPNGEEEELGVLIRYETAFKDNNQGYYSTQFRPYPKEWGRGEWEAKTLEDAKQMAKAFARGCN